MLTTRRPTIDKENSTFNLEEFGLSPTHSSSICPDAQQMSPSKESPSRRKRLMGSLRSMGSLRGLGSYHLKERAKERCEEPVVGSQVGVSYRCRIADTK